MDWQIRNWVSPIGALHFVSLVCGLGLGAERLEKSRPNIVLVITDDQGYAPLGCHGHPWIKTPHLDEMHAKSTRFTRFLVSPTCSPTRSALMTGRDPMQNGITHTIWERERMTLEATTLPQVLKEAGYKTGIFGKWHLGDEEPYQPHRRGFEETFIHGAGGIGQSYEGSCADAPGNKYFDPTIRHNGKFVKTNGFCTDVFFAAALGWIKEARSGDAPFFAYIAPNAPHGPYVAPKSATKRFAEMGFSANDAAYYGMIENIDDNMGRLHKKLAEWDLLKNTVVIFMSDNGMAGVRSPSNTKELGKTATGEILRETNAQMKGMKGSVDEGGVRVPFFVCWEGRIVSNRDIDRIAAHLDIFPTLAALAGARLPENQVTGRSLLPLFEDSTREWPDRFLFEHAGRWPRGANPDDFKWGAFAVRNQRFRLVGKGALYDMEKDAGQTIDVSSKHPEVVAEMIAAYESWWKKTRPLMVNESAPLSPTRPFHKLFREQEANMGIPPWQPKEL